MSLLLYTLALKRIYIKDYRFYYQTSNTSTQYIKKCDCVNYIFRLQIVPTLLERISHIGVLMSYWLNHVVLSNTTQISKFVSRNLTQKRKKNNVKLNEKKSKTLDLLGMENWEKNYGICLSTHRPQRVLRYVQVIIRIGSTKFLNMYVCNTAL